MSDEDDIIAFDDDEDKQPQPKQPQMVQSSVQSNRGNFQTKGSKVNPSIDSKVSKQSQEEQPKELDSQTEEPIINFSKLFKKTKDSQIVSHSLKVDSDVQSSNVGSQKNDSGFNKKSLFIKQVSDSARKDNDDDMEPALIKLEDPEQQDEDDQFMNEDLMKPKSSNRSQTEKKVALKKVKQSGSNYGMDENDPLGKLDQKSNRSDGNQQNKSTYHMKGSQSEIFTNPPEKNQEDLDQVLSSFLIIGQNSFDAKVDYYGCSQRSQIQSQWRYALNLAMKKAYFNPILPFIIIITILDKFFTSVSSWQFQVATTTLLTIVPVYLWYIIYKQELNLEYHYDKSTIMVYDFNLKKFINRQINRLYAGTLVYLKQGDRVPGPMLALTSDGTDFCQINYGPALRTFKTLAPKLSEGEVEYLEGKIEYSRLPLFIDGTRAKLKLDLLEPIEVILSEDDLIDENGIVESPQVLGILTQCSSQQRSYKETFSFNLPLFLNPINAEFFSIGLVLVLSFVFAIAGLIWSKKNYGLHQYIHYADSNNFGQMLIDHMVVFSSVIPIFIEVFRPLFLLFARYKINNDVTLEPEQSGNKSQIHSYFAIDNLASTKFVNYSTVLNDIRERVYKGLLIGGPQQGNEETKVVLQTKDPYDMKPKDQDELYPNKTQQFEQIELESEPICEDKERLIYALERILLTLPYGILDQTQLAIKKYCQLGDCVQFSLNDEKRSILLPKDYLRAYQLKLVVENDGWTAYLYEMPQDEDLEEEEEEEQEQDTSDLQQLQERIKKDRELFEKLTLKRYIWVIQANLDCSLCKEHPQLTALTQGKAFFEYEMKEEEYKKLYQAIGRKQFNRKYIQLPQYQQEVLLTQIKLIGVLQFQQQTVHNFHMILDLNLAIIRQWFFVREMESDATLMHLRQFMECIEFTKEDLSNEIQNLKSSAIPLYKQSLKEFKTFDNLYKIDDKYIALIITQRVIDAALNDGEIKHQFLECLMIASYVILLDLEKPQIEQLITFQREFAKKQTIVSFGASDFDISLCKPKTIRVSLSGSTNQGMFHQMSHIQLQNPDGLSKIILSHARQTHTRTAGFLLFQMYKCYLITMCEFFFSFFNGYSSQQLFTTSFHFMYQAYFTSFFSLIIFNLYSDVNHNIIRMFAGEFIKCQRDHFFNRKKLILIFLDSIYQGFLIFYFPALVLQYSNNNQGIIEGFYYISLVSYLTCILTALLQPVLFFSTLSKEQVITIIIDIILVIAVLFTTCSTNNISTSIPQYIYHLESVLNSVKSVFLIVFLSIVCLTPTYLIHQYETISDSYLIKMVHYYEEKEELEEEIKSKKQKKKNNKEDEKNDESNLAKKQQQTIEHSQIDPVNMSSDGLMK